MTILTTVRPYHRLDKFDRLIIDERVANFIRYAKRIRPQLARPKPTAPSSEKSARRTNVRTDVLVLIAEQGPLTSGEVAEHLGLTPSWANTLMCRMRADGVIFVVGNKRNDKHYWMNVYHTDPDFAYVPPEPPKLADPIVEKRPARIPSVAAVDRGLALIEQHFHEDGCSKRVFEQLCRRPQSVPELSAVLRMDDATVRFALRRLLQIGAVAEDGKEVTYDRTNRKHIRQVYAVVEVSE